MITEFHKKSAEFIKEMREGKVIGMCDGVFDLMHWGHILHLDGCSVLCDFLVVAVADDKFVKKFKGETRPVIGEGNRLYSVQRLKSVDLAFICDGSVDIVNLIMPDIYFKSYGYVRDPNLKDEVNVKILPLYGIEDKALSTTDLIKNVQGRG